MSRVLGKCDKGRCQCALEGVSLPGLITDKKEVINSKTGAEIGLLEGLNHMKQPLSTRVPPEVAKGSMSYDCLTSHFIVHA